MGLVSCSVVLGVVSVGEVDWIEPLSAMVDDGGNRSILPVDDTRIWSTGTDDFEEVNLIHRLSNRE